MEKLAKTVIPFCSITLTTINSFSQGLETVLKSLKQQEIGKKITNKLEYRISEATYLGKIFNSEGKTKYYVVKEFYKVKAAIVYHGHSRILFFNQHKKLVAQAVLNMPNELPYKLKDNFLYFKYKDKGISKNYKERVDILPKMICVDPEACYDVNIP